MQQIIVNTETNRNKPTIKDKKAIAKSLRIIDELAGILKTPKKWQGKSIDEIIELAQMEYYADPKNR